MNLKFLTTQDLDSRMKSLAQRERDLLHEILLTIKEIDSRRIYLDLSYSSLFAYLVDGVGYSAGSAQRRIDAARLLREIPEIGEKIQSGEIKLNQISMVQRVSREISKRSAATVAVENKKKLLAKLVNKSQEESQKEIASFFNLPVLIQSKRTIQSDGSVRYEITVSKELDEEIRKAQALLSHAVPSASLVDYITYVTKKVIQQKTSVRKKLIAPMSDTANQDKSTYSKHSSVQSTTVQLSGNAAFPATVAVGPKKSDLVEADMLAVTPKRSSKSEKFSPRQKKIVFNQNSRCEHKHKLTGKICGSKWFLQVDHKQSVWAGGKSGLQNAQVLCANHNHGKCKKESRIRLV